MNKSFWRNYDIKQSIHNSYQKSPFKDFKENPKRTSPSITTIIGIIGTVITIFLGTIEIGKFYGWWGK